jgi:hypothetical protein
MKPKITRVKRIKNGVDNNGTHWHFNLRSLCLNEWSLFFLKPGKLQRCKGKGNYVRLEKIFN